MQATNVGKLNNSYFLRSPVMKTTVTDYNTLLSAMCEIFQHYRFSLSAVLLSLVF